MDALALLDRWRHRRAYPRRHALVVRMPVETMATVDTLCARYGASRRAILNAAIELLVEADPPLQRSPWGVWGTCVEMSVPSEYSLLRRRAAYARRHGRARMIDITVAAVRLLAAQLDTAATDSIV